MKPIWMNALTNPTLALADLVADENLYDASYFWLAETLKVDLFTFDKVLSSACAIR